MASPLKKALGLVPEKAPSSTKNQETSEKKTPEKGETPAKSRNHSQGVEAKEEELAETPPPTTPPSSPKKPAKGHNHGRLTAEAYWGATVEPCFHEEFKIGDLCPLCQGKLYGMPPSLEIRVSGSPLATATCYELERTRCASCGRVFTTPLPERASPQKYDESIRAILALMTHSQGFPAKRIESFVSFR